MSKSEQLPVVLSIAGSDSGGGAGIQADLRAFAALGVHGATAVTCITAQNGKGLHGIEVCSAAIVRRQMEAVFDELRPGAVKIGMLYSGPIVRTVAKFFRDRVHPPLIVDPVMVSTSGAQLLQPAARKLLCSELLPLATLVTPNLHEAAWLSGQSLNSLEDLRGAARKLCDRFGCAALVKGGHLSRMKEAVDVFWDGQEEVLLRAPFIRGLRVRGTGCAYSAAIAAYLARGCSLVQAVHKAKTYINQALRQRRKAGEREVLGAVR